MSATGRVFTKCLVNAFGGESATETKKLDILSDTLKMILIGTSAVSAVEEDFWETYADVLRELTTGTGYTAGGVTLANVTMKYYGSSRASAWQTGHAYGLGDIVRPTTDNGYAYRCTTAGTSHATTEPTWGATIDVATTDNTAAWTCVATATMSWIVNTAYTIGAVRIPTTSNGHVYRCTTAGTSHATTEPTWPTTSGGTVNDSTVTWTECGRKILRITSAAGQWISMTGSAYSSIIYDATGATDADKLLIGFQDFGGIQSAANGTFEVDPDAAHLAYFFFKML